MNMSLTIKIEVTIFIAGLNSPGKDFFLFFYLERFEKFHKPYP